MMHVARLERENVGYINPYSAFGEFDEGWIPDTGAVNTGLPEAERLRLLGNDAYHAGDLEQALDFYSRGLASVPDHISLTANRAQVLLKLGRNTEVVTLTSTLLDRNGSDVKALLRRGYALAALGQSEEALQDLRLVMSLEPNHPQALRKIRQMEQAAAVNTADADTEGASVQESAAEIGVAANVQAADATTPEVPVPVPTTEAAVVANLKSEDPAGHVAADIKDGHTSMNKKPAANQKPLSNTWRYLCGVCTTAGIGFLAYGMYRLLK